MAKLIGIMALALLAGTPPALGQEVDIDQLLARVKAEEDAVPASIFGQIAAAKTPASLKALRRASDYLRTEGRLYSCYLAFSRYRDDPKLLQEAIGFLFDEARGHNRDENQRAAAKALTRLGEPALEFLEQLLTRHREEEVRRIVVQPLVPRLGAIGSRRAAETILDLASISTGVQEQAVYRALLACTGSKVLSLYTSRLLNPKTPEKWRALLLSVLGSSEEPGATKGLIDALGDQSAQIRTQVLEILGERRETGAIKRVQRHLTSDIEMELRQAIVTMTILQGGSERWEEQLLEYARDRRPAARMGAAAGLLELRTNPAVQALHRLLADEEWRVRVEALQQVANLRRASSLPHLIDRLAAERGRLKRDVSLVLRLLTGHDHGESPARWRAWWDAEGSQFSPPLLAEAAEAEAERTERRRTNQTTATFYGLEVVSERVAFVVDTSGSMSAKAGGKGRTATNATKTGVGTRLTVAHDELSGAIKGLSPGVMFNIIFFSSGVSPWQDELVEKNQKIQDEAVAFSKRQKPGGGTNIYDALLVAMDDRRVDTIYLLSDGDPSAGKVVAPALILERISKLNRTRKVQVHCISIGKRSTFMRKLAAQNGGVYKESL